MADRLDDLYKELVTKKKATDKAGLYEFEFDLMGNFRSVADDTLAFMGYSKQDIEGITVWDVVSEKDQDLILEKFAARKEGRPIDPYEVTLIMKSGKKIKVKVETTPVLEDGRVAWVKGRFTPL